MLKLTTVILLSGTLLTTTSLAQQSGAPSQGAQLQLVATFEHQVTGVTVSRDGLAPGRSWQWYHERHVCPVPGR